MNSEQGKLAQLGAPSKANGRQVGGEHYKATIQHWDYVLANDIPYLEAQIIKYLTRWRKKGWHADLRKGQHFMQKLFEHQGLPWYEQEAPAAEPTRHYVDQDQGGAG